MPESSFHYHRLLRIHPLSSHLLKSNPADPRNDIDIAHSSYLDLSPLSSRPFSGYAGHEKDGFGGSSPPASTTLSMPRSRDLVTQQPPYHPCLPHSIGSTSLALSMSPQQSSIPEPQTERKNQDIFHRFPVTGNILDVSVDSVMYVTVYSNQFMSELAKKTIPGAAFDSSTRDPPPRCQPGTRLAVLRRCIDFISQCDGFSTRIRWIVGAAGVGKSAVMQNVIESSKLPGTSNASIFFDVIGRNDGSKAIMTLTYQLAVKSEPYRRVIQDAVNGDPSLLESPMPIQFQKFIVEPFVHHPQLNTAGRVLIIIDGLDKCSSRHTQIELLCLISEFCILYPSSPIVWLIASRPEPHLTAFFSRREVVPVYEKEEILVDSDGAQADVERFLRDALGEISKASYTPDSRWPDKQDLWKLAHASGGLFAFAYTAIRYIGDPTIACPALQLSDVLNVIENHDLTAIPPEDHPMALLDALYARILSSIPSRIAINTRKLLLALSSGWDSALPRRIWSGPSGDFIVLCNWLNMTRDDAYAAVDYLCSVLRVPRRDKAHLEPLKPLHKSFMDYISDFSRSGFSPDIIYEAQQLKTQCAFRVLREAPGGINFGGIDLEAYGGVLARGPPGSGDRISFTWLDDKDVSWNSHKTRLSLYKLAIGEVVRGIQRGDPNFQNVFCIHLLTTRFRTYYGYFPLRELRELVFDESRYHEFTMRNVIERIPLRAVDVSTIFSNARLHFYRPATAVANLPDPWDVTCTHQRVGEGEEGKDCNWLTSFCVDDCASCYSRLAHQLGSLKVRTPDRAVPVLFTSTGNCCVEFRFVDEKDGMSEWRYWFWCLLTE